jgi:photosystem II stability/assembly factor-like uncharacterized protein
MKIYNRTGFILLAASALVFGAGIRDRKGPAPRLDSWRVIGPGGAGGMFLPTISPHDPNIVLEHCDMTGTYISLDGGESWRMFNLRTTASAIAFDQKTPGVIYIGNAALWRSEDTGKTWSMVFPDPKKDTVEHMRGDHAAPVFTTKDPSYPSRRHIRFIASDPNDSNRIFVTFVGRGRFAQAGAPPDTALYESRDYGRSWARIREFTGEQVHLIYVLPGSPDVRVVGESGVHRLADGRWQHHPAPEGTRLLSATAGAQNGRELLYATSAEAGGVYVSEDGGRMWQRRRSALPGEPQYLSIACSSKNAGTAYVGFRYAKGTRDGGREYGVAKTSDAGKSWSICYRESSEPASNVEHSWVADFYGGAGPIRDIFVAPANPDIVHLTDSCPRALKTADGGRTWQEEMAAYRGKDRWGRDKWTTTGFDVTTCYGVHFDPFRPKNIFISYTDVGLWKSNDGGQSWMSSISGIPAHWFNTTYWVEFDPKAPGLMWGAFARTHDLPRPKMWRRADPDTFQGGIAWSRDGGDHWMVAQGLPESAVTHIVLDPDSPAGSRALYATGFGKGVFKSTDSGKTWSLRNRGIEYKQPFAWRITRAANGTLYLVVARRSEERTSEAEDGALYKSTDGAESWTKMKLPAGCNGPTGLTLDPADATRMYLSAWGHPTPEGDIGGGVYLSTNAGATWSHIVTGQQHVYDVTVDPKNPNVLYHCGFDAGAWRSADRGATWKKLEGFNFKWGHRVIPDPYDAGKVYITTFGGSVWHGPAEGDPAAAEDVITKVKIAK